MRLKTRNGVAAAAASCPAAPIWSVPCSRTPPVRTDPAAPRRACASLPPMRLLLRQLPRQRQRPRQLQQQHQHQRQRRKHRRVLARQRAQPSPIRPGRRLRPHQALVRGLQRRRQPARQPTNRPSWFPTAVTSLTRHHHPRLPVTSRLQPGSPGPAQPGGHPRRSRPMCFRPEPAWRHRGCTACSWPSAPCCSWPSRSIS